MKGMSETALKVLVAEDQEINRFIIGKIFSKIGLNPEFAINGGEAYSAICTKTYDLVFMDIQMPIMTGIEVVEKLQKLQITLPKIVALTSNSSPSMHDAALRAGMDNVFLKPLDSHALQSILNTYAPQPQ
ncbi:MAG: response regulator [Bacteroidetes bacterium]|nr:MAG: response regulator [Bacteroidota bacterium]